MTGATAQLAEWVHRVDVRHVPETVVDKARLCLLDALACAGAGAQTAEMTVLTTSMRELDPAGPGRSWFVPGQSSLLTEAFVNATLIHALDYDDSHKRSKTHPGAPVLPAALAAARWVGADLSDLFAGIIAGYEVSMRLGNAVGVAAHRRSGWHATSTCGAIGAAAAVSRVLRLSSFQTASSIGNGATQAAGLWAFTNDGTMSKKFHPGHAARAGLTAATLAHAGITGSSVALEARDGGFFSAFAPQREESDWGEVLSGIGNEYWLPEVAFKPYPCCRTAHTAIDAVLALKEEGLNENEVESIEVHTYQVAVDQCGFNDPINEVQAAFSTPYLVACALIDGWVNASHFTKESVNDPTIRDLQRRIRVLHDPELDRDFPEYWPSRVAVLTKAGVTLEREVAVALGDPSVPMSDSQQARKMRAGVEPLLGVDGALALAEAVRELPSQGSSDPLWEALETTRRDAAGITQPDPSFSHIR